jgi:hypothetical protein
VTVAQGAVLVCSSGHWVQRVHAFNVWVRYHGEEDNLRRLNLSQLAKDLAARPSKRFVGEMTEEKAVRMASSMVTETILYSVCSPCLLCSLCSDTLLLASGCNFMDPWSHASSAHVCWEHLILLLQQSLGVCADRCRASVLLVAAGAGCVTCAACSRAARKG